MKVTRALFPLLVAGCASTPGPTVVTAATDAERAALLERVKTLTGSWSMTTPEGTVTAAVFAPSSKGSAMREIMFPGAEHEMTNMYHMDGSSLVLTHYCAAGNQPRMRARIGSDPNQLRFEFDGVTNFTADDSYMGSMTLTFIDADHVREEWSNYKDGKVDHGATFDLTRAK